MIELFEAETADQLWQNLANKFRKGNYFTLAEGRDGEIFERLHVGFSIKNPRQRWIVSRSPAINPAFALAEVIWIINGRNDSKFLNYWNKQLPKYAGICDTYYGAYGFRLKNHLGIDQLSLAYNALSSNPSTRQVVLQIWDARTDLPLVDGMPRNPDIPCNLVSLLKIRNNKLHWLQIIRSNDLYLGVPHNFVQFTCLQEIMAGWLNVELGSYDQISDSLHIYARDSENIKLSLPVHNESNNDILAESKSESETLFSELANRTDKLIAASLNKKDHKSLSQWKDAPVSYKNILLVLAAEGARRRRWLDLSREIMGMCTNPCYIQMWERWLNRVSRNKY